jgi:hypothetical protein
MGSYFFKLEFDLLVLGPCPEDPLTPRQDHSLLAETAICWWQAVTSLSSTLVNDTEIHRNDQRYAYDAGPTCHIVRSTHGWRLPGSVRYEPESHCIKVTY